MTPLAWLGVYLLVGVPALCVGFSTLSDKSEITLGDLINCSVFLFLWPFVYGVLLLALSYKVSDIVIWRRK